MFFFYFIFKTIDYDLLLNTFNISKKLVHFEELKTLIKKKPKQKEINT